jgi:predicted ATPase/class 3 adenylate cyclase
MDPATPLPTGTVTFLFTDVEGSTRLWEQHPEAMQTALARHNALITDGIQQHRGIVIKSRGEGDSVFAVFSRATDAIAAASLLQQTLQAEPWPSEALLRVRFALHTGEATVHDGDYFGAVVNRCARLRAAGHGGQVLLSQATLDEVQSALPQNLGFRDLGAHRLKDLQQPEHLFQLLHPNLPADFPPLRSLEAFAHNLPAQLTSFIGREQAMAEVKQLLATTRLLTLTGSGGCGKTRLALQVAADLLEEYPDGVWLIELAPLADPALVPQNLASALGLREEPGRPLTATLMDYLRTKSPLVVLDNCEHLLPACAQLADSVLRTCPQLRILASSREGLGIVGEQTYRVPSLSLPSAKPLPPLERLRDFEAVQLFADRARLSQATFAVTQANAPAVVHVCQRLDGIPLALELAAARVNVLSVEQISVRLDDRFRLLTGGSRTALPRQQTLRALIDWSYDLLTDTEQALLRRLAVFAGGWTLEAAEGVCAGEIPTEGGSRIEGWEVLNLLTSLVDKSLVVVEGSEPRYRLLETVRQYARDRLLEAGEAAVVRRRHRDGFLALAEAERDLSGVHHRASLDRLEREHDNLRAALGWSVAQGEGDEGLRLANALGWFWSDRCYWTEGQEHLAALLALPASQLRTDLRADALHDAGQMARFQGDLDTARALWEECLTTNRELERKQVIPEILDLLALGAWEQSAYEEAQALWEECLAIFRELGVQRGMALSLTGLGSVAQAQGRHEAARGLLEEAWALDQGSQNCVHQGHLLLELGDYATARSRYEQCLAERRAAGRTVWIAWSLVEVGHAAWLQGEQSVTQAHALEALMLFREFGEREGLLAALESLGVAALAQGEEVRAGRLMGAVESLRAARGLAGPRWWWRPRERMAEAARSALGEEAFAAAWGAGRALSLDQTVAFALEETAEV